MARPKSKDQLLELGKENYDKLLELINSHAPEERIKEFPTGTLNRNIRDVITHIHHWHLMAMDWYKEGIKGNKPQMPAEGYTWKTLPNLNKKIRDMYQQYSLEEGMELFKKSYKKLRKIIEKHSEEDLFEKKKYKWTGSTSMAAYFISATSSHYDWGIKLIKRSKK